MLQPANGARNCLALLIDDRVDRDGRLAGLPVADDQLALAAPDGDHRVDGLDARLHRLLHRFAGDDSRRLHLDPAPLFRAQGALAVDRLAERIEDAAHDLGPDGSVGDASRALDQVPFTQMLLVAHQRDTDRVLVEIEHQPHQSMGELDQLAGHHAFEAIDASDAVAGGEDRARLRHLDLLAVSFDLLAEDAADFICPDFRH